MDTPKSAKVSAEGVNGGEGRKTEAAEVFSRVQGRDGAASPAQWQEHRPDSAGARIGETALRRWVEQTEVEAGRGPEGALKRSEREELVELRRENRRLRLEREILKKATAFFAKESE
jgi:hypothetical protein